MNLSEKDIEDIKDCLETICLVWDDFKVRGKDRLSKNILDNLDKRKARAKELIKKLNV